MTEIIGTLYQMEGVAKVNTEETASTKKLSIVKILTRYKISVCQESAADRAQSIFSTLDFDGWFKNKLKSNSQ